MEMNMEQARAAVLAKHSTAYGAFHGGKGRGWIIRVAKALDCHPDTHWPLTADRRETEAEAWQDAASRLTDREPLHDDATPVEQVAALPDDGDDEPEQRLMRVTSETMERCEICYSGIPMGEEHFHFVGVWEGEPQNWRAHVECHETTDTGEGFEPGQGECPERLKGTGYEVRTVAVSSRKAEAAKAKMETCEICGKEIRELVNPRPPFRAWRLERNGEVSDGTHWHHPAGAPDPQTAKAQPVSEAPQPQKCGKPAASFIPRMGMSFACVLEVGHDGDCRPGGTCHIHGEYIGLGCPQFPRCISGETPQAEVGGGLDIDQKAREYIPSYERGGTWEKRPESPAPSLATPELPPLDDLSKVVCPACSGFGNSGPEYKRCLICEGRGEFSQDRPNLRHHQMENPNGRDWVLDYYDSEDTTEFMDLRERQIFALDAANRKALAERDAALQREYATLLEETQATVFSLAAKRSSLTAELEEARKELAASNRTYAEQSVGWSEQHDRAETAEASLATVREETIRKCVAILEVLISAHPFCSYRVGIEDSRDAILSQLSEKGR